MMVACERVHVRLVEFVDTERVTVPEKPFAGVMVIVEFPTLVESTARFVGLAVIVKSFAGTRVT